MTGLTNSTRAILKATYTQPVPSAVPAEPGVRTGPGSAMSVFAKLNFMRSLRLTRPEIEAMAQRLPGEHAELSEALETIAPSLVDRGPAAVASTARLYGGIDPRTLAALGRVVADLREPKSTAADPAADSRATDAGPPSTAPAPFATEQPDASDVGLLVDRFIEEAGIQPVGWLHLERIEMQPVGLERGELVSTIPMAPGETARVSHKEWSTQSEELSRIVTDELETYAEKGVAEKTDVAMSTANESKRDTNLNFGVTASGSYGTVSVTSTLNYGVSTSDHESRQASTKHATEITSKASSRSRKEHKVSFRTETRRGEEDEAARVITNNTTRVMRIDYYRIMRKWRVDLMRYGLRMTYDLVVPDPGGALRRQLMELAEIDKTLATPYEFPFGIDQIARHNWMSLAARYGAPVTAPPAENLNPPDYTYEFPSIIEEGDAVKTRYQSWQIDLPEGYELVPTLFEVNYYGWRPAELARFDVLGDEAPQVTATPVGEELKGRYQSALAHLNGKAGHISIQYTHRNVSWAGFRLAATLRLSTHAYGAWQLDTWQKLREAAEQQYYTLQQRLRDRREQLLAELNRDDTLTLRRAEREELMKRSLQWLFGSDFDTAPDEIDAVLAALGTNGTPTWTDDIDPSALPIGADVWLKIRKFGEFVKFLHQAVEWENVLYFLYPYFWGSEKLAEVKRLLWHPDPLRREFLRAGAARVVLPIRPGFERAFSRLMSTGRLDGDGSPDPEDPPYMSIAQEIEAYARTNYPGIPPANPDIAARARPLLTVNQQRAWREIGLIVDALEKYAEKAKQQDDPTWRGAPIEPEYYPTTRQGLRVLLDSRPNLTVTDPWGKPYLYQNPGRTAPFVVSSQGADTSAGGTDEGRDISTDAEGNLVGTWFEYTPCSGLDIEVGSDFGDNG
ncbi:type II secretion system protein GspG [Streptomyces sp. NBC_01092]|uniref:type II secretion system protein GspG n=1 Tax=Streptomyces sp. NBC_01092 TaxID=2903748 RepID=UPI003865987F|nr:type II secretion system protein GspG [Streptomyces sp. NBC_01092]